MNEDDTVHKETSIENSAFKDFNCIFQTAVFKPKTKANPRNSLVINTVTKQYI